jgi:hypothetical protein
MGGELGASAIQKFFDRLPKVFAGASSAPRRSPPPDKPCSFRLPDRLSAARTQTRPGATPVAGGGTIIFQGIKDFAAESPFTPPMGVEQDQTQPKNEWRIILWSRNDDPSTLRAFTIGERSQARGTKLICGEVEAAVEPAFESDFAPAPEIAEQHRTLPDKAASPLAVWTLWTNPQYL